MLRSLFRPKWQHKDPIIRSQAIASLNPHHDGEILFKIALNDSDASVRQAAICRINQLKYLHQLHQQTTFIADKAHIQQCWCSVLSDADLTTAIQAENIVLDCLEPLWLAAIVRYSNNSSLKHLALTGLRDETLIFQLLQQTKDNQLWQLLVQQLEGEEALKQALSIIKGRDKKTSQILRQRLDIIQCEQQEKLAIQQHIEEIEERLQYLLKAEHTPLLEGVLLNIEQQLQQTELVSDKALALLAQCQEKLKQQLQIEAHEKAVQEQQALANGLLQTMSEQLTLSSEQINQLEQLQQSDDSLIQQYISKIKQLLAATQQLEKLQEQLATQSSQTEKLAIVEQALKLIEKHDALSKHHLATFQQLSHQYRQQQKQQRETQKHSSKQLQQLISQADNAIADSDFATVKKLYPLVRKEFNKLDGQQRPPFQAALQRLQATQTELQQWQEFATDPIRDELCQAMEGLTTSEEHPREKAKQIKALQQRWKKLGFCHDQALWQRFQDLSDQAYQPCKDYFAEQHAIKQFNAEQCDIICQQIEEFQLQLDWQQIDFRSLDNLLRNIDKEWRKYNLLDRKLYSALQQRYSNAIAPLKEKLNQHKKSNTAQLEQLLQQAKTLLTMDDSQLALQAYQDIHEQWKQVGMSFFKIQRDLWQQLRQVGDEIYQRRNQQRNEAEEQLLANAQQASTLITSIQNCQDEAQLQLLQQDFYNLGSLPKNQYKTLQSQFHAAIKQFHQKQQNKQLANELALLDELLKWSAQYSEQEANPHTSDLKPLEHWPNHFIEAANKRLQEQSSDKQAVKQLCIEAELLADIASPSEDEALRMQVQMQQLQAHFTSGQNQHALNKLNQLVLHWVALPKGKLTGLPSLQQRFYAAVDSLKKQIMA